MLTPTRAAALALLAIVLGAKAARGAGFEYPDLGARALGRAGAFAATADDPTAIAYNPAGLAWLRGIQVLGEGNLSWNDASFRRREAPYTSCTTSPTTGETTCKPDQTSDSVALRKQPNDGEVANLAGGFAAGFGAATYTLELSSGDALGFAFGMYGPPAIGRYRYAAPDYSDANFEADASNPPGDFREDPRRTAPNRYALVSSDIFIAYPGVSFAYRRGDWLAAGVTLQYVVFSMELTQAITDARAEFFAGPEQPGCDTRQPGTCGPAKMRDENPYWDSLVTLRASGSSVRNGLFAGAPTLTGVLGLMVRPHPRLSVGASLRPGYHVSSDGQLSFQLSRLAGDLGATVEGNEARLDFSMPHEARLGVKWLATEDLEIELDGTWEGWSALDRFTITPKDVRVVALGAATPVAPITLEKHFQDAWSARLGAEYRLPWALPFELRARVRAGLLYETSAILPQYLSIDFPNWERFGETAGFTVGTEQVEATVAVAFLQQPELEVTDSRVTGLSSDQNLKPFVVGNGTYRSSFALLTGGLRTRF